VHFKNLETACQSGDCVAPVRNLEIVHYSYTLRLRTRDNYAISRFHSTSAQSQDRAMSSPSTSGVYSSPPPHTRDFWEVYQLGETPFPSVWVWVQNPQTCGVPPFKASPYWIALNSFPFVSSACLLHSRIALEQSQDYANVLCSLTAISQIL